MEEYEATPRKVDVVEYDGTNLEEVREFVAEQTSLGRVEVVTELMLRFKASTSGWPPVSYPLLPGLRIVRDKDGWLSAYGPPMFDRSFHREEENQ